MHSATYVRKENGIFRDGRRVLPPSVARPTGGGRLLSPTPWTLSHEELVLFPGVTTDVEGNRLRLSHPHRGFDVIQMDVSKENFRLRFASLNDPILKAEGARLVLEDGGTMVAEMIPAWRDVDEKRGILSRVETWLPSPADLASAILLFQLEAVPPMRLPDRSSADVPIERFAPDQTVRGALVLKWTNLPRLLRPQRFVAPAPPLGF